MDPQYRLGDKMADYRSFSHNSNRDRSGHTSLSNTWVQTPDLPLPRPQYNGSQYSSEPAYFNGQNRQNGYLVDVKGKQPYEVNERSVQSTPMDTPRDSIDLEEQKREIHAFQLDTNMKDPNQPKIPFGQRIKHFTWAWYTLTMSTGGVATLISVQPHQFHGLLSIGAFFYVLNLIMFTTLCTLMIIRFAKFPGSFKESIKHSREGLFLGPFFLSIATIITSTQKYVVQAYDMDDPRRGWMITSISIAFWLYTFLTFSLAVFQYSFLFVGHTYLLTKFMPSWLLPVFPVMLAGTIASTIAADQPIGSRMPILVAGLGCQGLGFTVAIIMYAHYIGRLMQVGLPDREHRPAMFIGVGPPSFTCLALIGMANALPKDFDLQGDGLLDGNLLRTLALVVALFLWVLAMWFFMIALVATLHSRPRYFHLGWWAMVFPNTGFVIATITIGKELKDETILFVGNGLTIGILVMWLFVLFCNLRAVWVVDIMYPGRDEDVED